MEQVNFRLRKGQGCRRLRHCTVDHREPQAAPAQDAEQGQQVCQAVGSSEYWARQPDFKILWNVSIFQRHGMPPQFLAASCRPPPCAVRPSLMRLAEQLVDSRPRGHQGAGAGAARVAQPTDALLVFNGHACGVAGALEGIGGHQCQQRIALSPSGGEILQMPMRHPVQTTGSS